MSTLLHHAGPSGLTDTAPQTPTRPMGGLALDWTMIVLGSVFLGGLYLDGWAHNNGRVDQSFFTPWHAFFYSGFALVVVLLLATMAVNMRRGANWQRSLPAGYSLALLGVMIFATGGIGDLIWHELFGIEENVDALFSPSHLALGLGLGLIVTGPLRAAWARPGGRLTWATGGPMLLSLTALICTLTFLTMYSYPLTSSTAGINHDYNSDAGQIGGAVGTFLTAGLLIGPVLLVLRRWQLPLGSLILIWGLNTIAMQLLNSRHDYAWWQAGTMLVAVVVSEGVYRLLRPSSTRTVALHGFAFAAPVLLLGSYFIAMLFTEGTSWSIHLWTGTVIEAGLVGWLLSYLVAPPAMPTAVEDIQ